MNAPPAVARRAHPRGPAHYKCENPWNTPKPHDLKICTRQWKMGVVAPCPASSHCMEEHWPGERLTAGRSGRRGRPSGSRSARWLQSRHVHEVQGVQTALQGISQVVHQVRVRLPHRFHQVGMLQQHQKRAYSPALKPVHAIPWAAKYMDSLAELTVLISSVQETCVSTWHGYQS